LALRSKRRGVSDAYYRTAKAAGYRSRSSYKLIQLSQRFRLLRPGNVVVDLGAAPGGWLQVAAELVGDSGFVLGVDLDPIIPLRIPNVRTIQGDLTSPTVLKRISDILPRLADVLLSDAAPHVSGNWSLDQARQLFLAEKSLEAGGRILRPGGSAVLKAFQGSDYEQFLTKARSVFRSVEITKPSASRRGAAEVYLICRGFVGEGLV
jgi:23S rRNA (uridine2552-2'-O)-methyltransferase